MIKKFTNKPSSWSPVYRGIKHIVKEAFPLNIMNILEMKNLSAGSAVLTELVQTGCYLS